MTEAVHRAGFRAGRLLAAAALLLLGPSVGAPPARAVDNLFFNAANGHYYRLYQGLVNYSQAKTLAEADGGYVLTLTSQEESTWVLSTFSIPVDGIWLGASDAVSEGAWTWVTGEAWSWTNWNSGEPNNSGNEDYVEMYTSGKWNDLPDTHTNHFIAEWDVNPNAPPPPVTPAAPSGLVASLAPNGTIGLSWQDNATNESEFEVERMTVEDPWTRIARPGVDVTTLTDTVLEPVVDYTYRVRAKNAAGVSDWSNEATATSGTYIPSPRAPSDLVVTDAGPATMDLQWTDNSDGETAFEVHRRVGTAAFAFLASLPPDATTYHAAGLSPDSEYGFQVRAVGTLQASSFVATSGSTEATLAVASTKGDLKDSAKFAMDSIKVTLSWSAIGGKSDGEFDPVAEGLTLRLGPDAAPLGFKVLPDDAGWKGKGTKWKWKSPKGLTPKISMKLDAATGVLSVAVASAELAAPAANPVRVSVVVGDDAGTERKSWTEKKAGFLQLR